MKLQSIATVRQTLNAHTRLTDEAATATAALAIQLVSALPLDSSCTVALSGPPGTGKSTLALACQAALGSNSGAVVVLSLDDYYLTRTARRQLGERWHPVFTSRGPAGTHDVALLRQHILSLKRGRSNALSLPSFNKETDDRAPQARIIEPGPAPTLLIVEGWLLGAQPQSAFDLQMAANRWEEHNDADGVARRIANQQLEIYHQTLSPLFDLHWHMQAPDWQHVIDWRFNQEQELAQPRLQTRQQVADFLGAYQRVCEEMQKHSDTIADRVITFDIKHQPNIQAHL